MDHAERLAAALQGIIWGTVAPAKAQEILNDYNASKKENKMGNISRAMEQMERGLASKQGRDEVNAETMDQREQRAKEREERLADVAAILHLSQL